MVKKYMTHDDDHKIIRLPTPEERAAKLKQQMPVAVATPPLINLPPYTKYLLGVLLFIHIIVHYALNAYQQDWVYGHLGFVPAQFIHTPWALVTHMFLHGGWVHMGMNGVMLAAFGSGMERWMGGRKLLLTLLFCGVCGALFQYALMPFSPVPMIGASGALSGLFALAIVMMRRQGGTMGQGRFGIWPFIALWIGISIVFGLMGAPDGSPVAWGAHVGGFLAGFAALKILKI